jgi:hypothetical protein
MCSCRNNNGPCGNKSTELRNLRTRAVTLYNRTTDETKKTEYRSLISDLDSAIQNSKETCPSQEVLDAYKAFLQ